jgi:hypothetical protein
MVLCIRMGPTLEVLYESVMLCVSNTLISFRHHNKQQRWSCSVTQSPCTRHDTSPKHKEHRQGEKTITYLQDTKILHQYNIRDNQRHICTQLPCSDKTQETILNVAIFWDIVPCCLYANRRFGGTYHLHNQGRKSVQKPSNSEHVRCLTTFLKKCCLYLQGTKASRVSKQNYFVALDETLITIGLVNDSSKLQMKQIRQCTRAKHRLPINTFQCIPQI